MRISCFALLCTTFLLLGAVAQAQPSVQDILEADPKLQCRVTVEAEGISVGDLLALLSRKAGVTLRATSEAAEDKVIVFSRSRPLHQILSDLAALFGDTWQSQTSPTGSQEYLVTRITSVREQEKALAGARRDAFMSYLEAQVAALAETPEQLARRPADDPIRLQLTDYTDKNAVPSYGRVGTRLYAQLSGDQKEQLFARKRLTVPFASMTPPQQTLAREAFAQIVGKLEKEAQREIAQGIDVPDTVPPTIQDLETGVLQLIVTQSPKQGSIGMMLGHSLRNRSGRAPYVLFGYWKNEKAWLLPAHGNPYTGKPVASDAVLPTPKHIRAAAEVSPWPERLYKLAEESGTPVMADYYRCLPLPNADESTVPSAEQSAGGVVEMLNAFCQEAHTLWWVRGKTLLLRSRDWYDQKRYETPEKWLVETTQRMKAQQSLPTLKDAFRLLDLTLEQMEGLYRISGKNDMSGVRELLALVKASPTTLTYTQFTPLQRSLAPALLETLSYSVPPEQINELSLSWRPALRKPQTTPSGYSFAEAMLSFSLGKGTPQQGRIVLLPITLPDDRRHKTRIEIDVASS